MKTAPRRRALRPAPSRELAELGARLAEAEETLRAIRSGEVDAVVVAGKRGARVFTLEGAEHAYRVLIESMNEGALTITADKTILYANERFARMVKSPLRRVIGGSLRRFLSAADRATLRAVLKRAGGSGSKIQVLLIARDGSHVPAQVSIRPLSKNGHDRAPIGVVVTDMTEARRSEDMLRALSHRLVRAQEAERGRVALELHDHITQLLCAVLIRSQALANRLSTEDGPSKAEAITLREMLGKTADEVERVSRALRPSVLDELGLVAGLRAAGAGFADRTSVPIELACARLATRLPPETELSLYRILQEALRNVERHARARHVKVRLRVQGAFVELLVTDDGIGFDPLRRPARKTKANGGLGLLSMRERAAYVGGTLTIKSARRVGTEIEARIPLSTLTTAAS